METVYLVGLFAGLGASLGLAFAGALAGTRGGYAPAAVLAAVVGILLGLLLAGWPEAIAGAVGGLLGGAGAGPVVRGTLQRGGTRTGTALLFALVALGGAVLALVPLVGYLEAIALPVLALRVRRRGGGALRGTAHARQVS